MSSSRWRGAGLALLAGAGAGLLGPAGPVAAGAAVAAGAQRVTVALRAFDDWQAEIMAGTGMPVAPQPVLDAFGKLYLGQYPNLTPNALDTPEEFYGVTGIKSLTFDQSMAESLPTLDDRITQQIGDGHNVVVVGHSQGATVASLEMRHLMDLPADQRPDPEHLHFVLTGDPSNPLGGILARFDGLSLPSLGVSFSGPDPVDTVYQTDIYTAEYDGFADFPKYPLNVLADLNALAGVVFVHPSAYLDADLVAQATVLGTDGNITYHIIPTEHLPLLEPIRLLPYLGKPIADLLEPDLKTLVDLGYGGAGLAHSPLGDDPGFGVLPQVDLGALLGQLAAGAETGFQAFTDDLGHLTVGPLGDLGAALGDAADGGGDAVAGTVLTPASALTEIGQILSSIGTAGYSWLLPTADLANAVLTSIPAYDVSLFADGVQQLLAGDPAGLLDAIGKPIAADLGLLMLGGGWWFESALGTLQDPVAELSSFVADLSATLADLAP